MTFQFKADQDLFRSPKKWSGRINLFDSSIEAPPTGEGDVSLLERKSLLERSAAQAGFEIHAKMQWCAGIPSKDRSMSSLTVRHANEAMHGIALSLPEKKALCTARFSYLIPGEDAVHGAETMDSARLKRLGLSRLAKAGLRIPQGLSITVRPIIVSLDGFEGAAHRRGVLVGVSAGVFVQDQEALRVALTRGTDADARPFGVGILHLVEFR